MQVFRCHRVSHRTLDQQFTSHKRHISNRNVTFMGCQLRIGIVRLYSKNVLNHRGDITINLLEHCCESVRYCELERRCELLSPMILAVAN